MTPETKALILSVAPDAMDDTNIVALFHEEIEELIDKVRATAIEDVEVSPEQHYMNGMNEGMNRMKPRIAELEAELAAGAKP